MNQLIGNSHIRQTLMRFYEKGRMPNAMLFAGPRGVGKKEFALEVARMFVCVATDVRGACGECAPCKRVGTFALPTSDKGDDYKKVFFGDHPDVGIVIPFKRNVLVDAIRELERESNFRPYEAAVRIFIVNDAEKMNEAASNALLKTLEEPAPTTHIILIASRADRLLPTIRSRCQVMRFSPVGAEEIERLLIGTGKFSAEDAALAARLAEGSVERALETVPASLRTQRSRMLEVLRAAAESNRMGLLAASEEMGDAKNKDEFEPRLEILRGLVHDVWLIKNNGDDSNVLNIDILDDLRNLSDGMTSPQLADTLGQIEEVYENFVVNINRKAATDSLFVTMASAR